MEFKKTDFLWGTIKLLITVTYRVNFDKHSVIPATSSFKFQIIYHVFFTIYQIIMHNIAHFIVTELGLDVKKIL